MRTKPRGYDARSPELLIEYAYLRHSGIKTLTEPMEMDVTNLGENNFRVRKRALRQTPGELYCKGD